MNRRVPWWQAFAFVPLLVGLFVGEQRLRFSPAGHQTVQVIIVLFIFGLLNLWLKAQDGARIWEEVIRHRMTFEERQAEPGGRAFEPAEWEEGPALRPDSNAPAEKHRLPPAAIHPVEQQTHHSLN
jgi:hypothetical protein